MIDWLSGFPREGVIETTNGITINVPTRSTLFSEVARCFEAGEGFSVATLNLDHVVKIRRSSEFHDAYAAHRFVVADGNPIVWLSRLAGNPVELMPGSELIDPLVEVAADHDAPIALLGSTEQTLKIAAQKLSDRHPRARFVSMIAPSRDFDPTGEEADECIQRISDSGARLCFLALGAPKQEIFAIHASGTLTSTGFVSIGAGLDFIAGSQRRAPKVFRRFAMEWLWRLIGNPKRLAGRYLSCFMILPSLAVDAVRAGRVRSTADGSHV